MNRAPSGAVILDVRGGSEHARCAMPGSIHIPHTQLARRLADVPCDGRLLVHCKSGQRSAFATTYLRSQGYDATNVAGGIDAWLAAGGQAVRTEECAI